MAKLPHSSTRRGFSTHNSIGTDNLSNPNTTGGTVVGTQPGMIEYTSQAGDKYYTWADNSGNLRLHSSIPTNPDTDGSVVTSGLTDAELEVLDGATAGTQVASKAVIADANVNTGISKITELHIGASGSETQVNATAAELNTLDQSANTETIDSGVAADATITHTAIDNTVTGAGAITLAAPAAAMIGKTKIIEMTVDGGNVTLALTNVTGGSAATTCTWANVDEALVLVGGTNKWHVVAESGVVLS